MIGTPALVLAFAVSAGPFGSAFYTPPSPLPPATHGDAIWARAFTGAAALPDAASNLLVLYHTTALDGRDVALSATLAIPRGTPPAGGWRIVSWTHGTTGIGGACAPSRDSVGGPAHGYLAENEAELDALVRHGDVVVQTDYEGLGGPGPHPYLIGEAEARDAIDAVRAARQVDPTIGSRYVVAGHSQGGQAALFVGALAASWAPELTLLGDAALAPASHVLPYVQSLTNSRTPTLGFAFIPYIVEGVAAVDPAVRPDAIFAPAAVALLPQAQTACIDQLRAPGSWGSLVPADAFRSGADLGPLEVDLAANDPGTLRIRVPTLIAQGAADTVVAPIASDLLVRQLCANAVPLLYTTYPNATHRGLLTASLADLERWIDARFDGSLVPTNCDDPPRAAPSS